MESPADPSQELSVESVIELIKGRGSLDTFDKVRALEELEDRECWEPYIDLLIEMLRDNPPNPLSIYLKIAKVQNMYMKHREKAVLTCQSLISNLQISFSVFRSEVIPYISEEDDVKNQIDLLERVYKAFLEPCRVECLEYIALLYEKRLHDEGKTHSTYKKLLEIERSNIRALRYFKNKALLEQDWQGASKILKDLLESLSGGVEKARVVQELALLQLQHLNLPQEALLTLNKNNHEEGLDQSSLRYDIYSTLEDWEQCLRCLDILFLAENDTKKKSMIQYRRGHLFSRISRIEEARSAYLQAYELWDQFLEPLEELVHIAILQKDWANLETYLRSLENVISSTSLRQRLSSVLLQIKERFV